MDEVFYYFQIIFKSFMFYLGEYIDICVITSVVNLCPKVFSHH